MSGPAPFVAVRQEQRQAAETLHFASPELMNWSMMTWAPLAKSPYCASQTTRAFGSVVE